MQLYRRFQHCVTFSNTSNFYQTLMIDGEEQKGGSSQTRIFFPSRVYYRRVRLQLTCRKHIDSWNFWILLKFLVADWLMLQSCSLALLMIFLFRFFLFWILLFPHSLPLFCFFCTPAQQYIWFLYLLWMVLSYTFVNLSFSISYSVIDMKSGIMDGLTESIRDHLSLQPTGSIVEVPHKQPFIIGKFVSFSIFYLRHYIVPLHHFISFTWNVSFIPWKS